MSIMDQISKPKSRPIIATITGDPGIGKTSLAATFPKPIFIRAEDGMISIPEKHRPDAFPLVKSVGQLKDQLKSLIVEPHDYKTLVIDTVTTLDILFTQHIIDSDDKKLRSINQALGGYGAGLAAVSALHQNVRTSAQTLNEKGMHIIFVAHSDTVKVEPPDHESYTRYDLRLSKRSLTHYVDNVDLVAYVRQKMFIKDNKAISDSSRVCVCHTQAACISKNRFGIKDNIDFIEGKNPFKEFINNGK